MIKGLEESNATKHYSHRTSPSLRRIGGKTFTEISQPKQY